MTSEKKEEMNHKKFLEDYVEQYDQGQRDCKLEKIKNSQYWKELTAEQKCELLLELIANLPYYAR